MDAYHRVAGEAGSYGGIMGRGRGFAEGIWLVEKRWQGFGLSIGNRELSTVGRHMSIRVTAARFATVFSPAPSTNSLTAFEFFKLVD